MPNVLLTSLCVRSCPYCFAKKEMADAEPQDVMSWENLVYIADFFAASNERGISLLGGEPTLHPEFVDIVLYLLDRGFHVTVFTSGIMARAKLEQFERHLAGLTPGPLSFVCNLNDPEQTPCSAKETESLSRFLAAMGPFVSPGFNIYRVDFRLEFLFELISRYGLSRHLRLGIAHPLPGLNNIYIKPEQIGLVAERLYGYRDMFDRFRVKPGLDCGFPMCQFTDEQLGWLHRLMGSALRFGCGMALDIMPDMTIYNCFPLSTFYRKPLYQFDSLEEVTAYYKRCKDQIRVEMAGIYPQCDGCCHREDAICEGGGACQILNRFAGEAPIRLPEIEHELSKPGLSL